MVIITDDGLASGYTMLAAAEALRAEGSERIIIAVPTGSSGAVAVLPGLVDTLICLNLRDHTPFAVAEAYENWYDLDDEEVIRLLNRARKDRLFYGIT